MKAFIAFLILLLFAAPAASAYVYHDYYGPYGGDEWVEWQDTWEYDWLENGKSHATPPFAPTPTFGGCYISTGKGLLDDLDCDDVPDLDDNCLGLPNEDQYDQNGNGLGDACDLIVNLIEVNPTTVLQGRSFSVDVTLTNYRPYDLRNTRLTVQIPELGLEQEELVDTLPAGMQDSYELYFRLPDCVPAKRYDVVLFVTYPSSPGKEEFFYIPAWMNVHENGMCGATGLPPASNSVIDILDIQDVDREDGGIYPFTIMNHEPYGQAYVFTVEGLEDWGWHEIRPRSLIVVPPGGSAEGELVVYADAAASGEHGFVLTVRSKADAQQVLMTAHVSDEIPVVAGTADYQLILFILIVLLVFFGIGILLFRTGSSDKK